MTRILYVGGEAFTIIIMMLQKMKLKQFCSTNQHLEKLKNINMNILIFIGFINLFFGVTGNVLGDDYCPALPTSALVVNVKDKGAKGDGITDDTVAIQATIDQIAGTGGTVLVPDGTYLINAITSIQIKSDMTLRMSTETLLKALPNGNTNYSIINITGASNINVINGTLVGERDEHLGTSGEWGMGITLRDATNVVIQGVTARNCWGDGFYIRGDSKNVKFCSVIAENNRRQGMSIISVDGMIVKNSVFKNTRGTAPQAGIDIEPNEEDTINNVQIMSSQFIGNKGAGIQLAKIFKHSSIKNVTLDGNTIRDNLSAGIEIINTADHKIMNNLVQDNKGFGIHLNQEAEGNMITGNTVFGKRGIKDEGGKNKIFANVFD